MDCEHANGNDDPEIATYADRFDEDLDDVADRLDAVIRVTADGFEDLICSECFDLLKLCGAKGGAKGNRTPDLLDANESRYQLRHSP